MQLKINFLCRDSILAAPIVLDSVLFLDLAKRAGMSGIQEWLSFYFKSPMHAPEVYPEHDLFIQLMKLKNTLRYLQGEDLITHLGPGVLRLDCSARPCQPLSAASSSAVLSALPVVGLGNCCCCLWVVCGGVLAAYLDQQSDPTPITVGRGAFTGFLAGIIGAIVWIVVAWRVERAPGAASRQSPRRDESRRPEMRRPKCGRLLEWVSANAVALPAVAGLLPAALSSAPSSQRLAACWARRSSATTCRLRSAVPFSLHRSAALIVDAQRRQAGVLFGMSDPAGICS